MPGTLYGSNVERVQYALEIACYVQYIQTNQADIHLNVLHARALGHLTVKHL